MHREKPSFEEVDEESEDTTVWKETRFPRSRALEVTAREHHAHHVSGERSGELFQHCRERRRIGCGVVLPRAEKHRKAYPKLRRILEGRRIYR